MSPVAEISERIADIRSRIAALDTAAPATQARAATSAAGASTGSDFASALTSAGEPGRASRVSTFAPVPTSGATASAPGSAAGGEALLAAARKHLGVPYVYGGTDPATGLDCSGLIQLAAKQVGIPLPRTAAQQAQAGTAVPSLAQAKPGDLVVLENGGHIGIYAGDGQMLHAPRTGGVVKIAKIWETPTAIRRVTAGVVAAGAVAGGAVAGAALGASSAGASEYVRPPALAGAPSGPVGSKSAPYDAAFTAAEQKYGLPAGLLSAVAKQESGYNPHAKSPVGALGLMQFMPGTAREMGVDPLNPASAIDGAGRLLSKHLKSFGSLELALAAYNAGPGNVKKHGGIPPFDETQNYVKKIIGTLGRSA
ncbi:cell wall-associated NlpC family hydrolase [Kineococcus xinjiangensis]|uniref:Cell wall-associated NlpC family hydrolase n=1 Tax=Kineococcus xinjiangensis TaxID=512762 RepID=A0A2S6IK08_9ACTN|nr:transglycosylase SLT domain-containing protein [Kineococcus xinjiangensis]PPK94516.1 cell wall-associated NlpC family hydrolase [Kineococcus xinjiangensis]